MNQKQYIRSRFEKILKESIHEKAESIMNRLNLKKETDLYDTNEFDYVQEGEACEQCGSEMTEKECMECGWKGSSEVMEFEDDIDYGNTKYGLGDDDDEDDYRDLSMYNPYYGDDDEEEYYPELRMPRNMPSYKTKYRHSDDEEEEITEKLHGKQRKLDKNENNRIDSEDFKMLRKQQDETEQLYEVEFEKEVGEGETDESKEFAYAAMMAKKKGKKTFELDGETFDVKESYMRKKSKVNESILFTETDLIDFIEKIVNEDKKFRKSEPKGFREYERVHKADKKENENYLKSVAKKMTDYLKGMNDESSKYEMKETQKFPTENGGLKKGIRKKYTPSDAVDEYIDAFNYGSGQTGLRFDEIKPNDKNIEKYLKGDSTTGNAQVDEDGNALGNVVPSKVGDKFYDMYKNNLFGQEQAEASYKRQPQPVDQAGEHTERGSLKSRKGKKTSQSVLNKLEENVNEKESKKLNEEFDRIQDLMGYNRKTQ